MIAQLSRFRPALAILLAVAAPAQARTPGRTVVVDFEAMPTGLPPTGMTIAQTGDGERGVWTVTDDPTSRGRGRVLTQTEATPIGRRFPLCVYDALRARDVSVQVAFKTMTGDSDRAAGICVRYLDQDNYYCCRTNSLEDNYRFYKVVDGRRVELGGVNHLPIIEDVWQTMRLDANGSHFTMWLNGARIFEVDDDTFRLPGKVGLWLKGDSITSFDELRISPPGTRRTFDFEQRDAGAAGRELASLATGDEEIAWRLVDAAVAGGGICATPDAPAGEPNRRSSALLLVPATTASDASISTRFKVRPTGPGMHLAGLVARYRSGGDHYYLRINLAECNLRLYRVRGGQRRLLGERHHTRFDERRWHTAQLTAIGQHFEVLVDGELQFAVYDDAAAVAGRVGVQAAPGGGTWFDEIAVETFDGRGDATGMPGGSEVR